MIPVGLENSPPQTIIKFLISIIWMIFFKSCFFIAHLNGVNEGFLVHVAFTEVL